MVKLPISPGWWLTYVSTIYLVAGLICFGLNLREWLVPLQLIYVLILQLPLWFKPLADWVGTRLWWE